MKSQMLQHMPVLVNLNKGNGIEDKHANKWVDRVIMYSGLSILVSIKFVAFLEA